MILQVLEKPLLLGCRRLRVKKAREEQAGKSASVTVKGQSSIAVPMRLRVPRQVQAARDLAPRSPLHKRTRHGLPTTTFEIGSSAADRMSPIIEGRHEIEDSPLNVERLNQECVLVTADSPITSSPNYRLESGSISLTGTTFTDGR